MEWVEDVAVRRAVRSAIATRLVDTTRAGTSIFFERTDSIALSDMPALNIVSFPPESTGPDERRINFAVVGVLAKRDEAVEVLDDCGVCIDSLVVDCDEFDNEIRLALDGLNTIAGCTTHCIVSEISPSVLQFSNEGAKPSVLIRRLVSATYLESLNI